MFGMKRNFEILDQNAQISIYSGNNLKISMGKFFILNTGEEVLFRGEKRYSLQYRAKLGLSISF